MTASPGSTDWKLKVESAGAATAVEVSLSSSLQQHAAPRLNEWQHYTFPLSALAAQGLDVGAIDLVLIFPEWGTGNGAVYRIDNLEIRSNVSRFAPVIDSSPVLTATQNNLYSYTLSASDADNDVLILSAPRLPDWLLFDSVSGILSGTPTPADVGTHDVTLSASDGGDSATQSFTIEVSATDSPPYITSALKVVAKVGKAWRYQLLAEDADGDALTLTVTSAPGWLTFDAGSGELSGKPGKVYRGTNKVTFAISDGKNIVRETLRIKVKRKGSKSKRRD